MVLKDTTLQGELFSFPRPTGAERTVWCMRHCSQTTWSANRLPIFCLIERIEISMRKLASVFYLLSLAENRRYMADWQVHVVFYGLRNLALIFVCSTFPGKVCKDGEKKWQELLKILDKRSCKFGQWWGFIARLRGRTAKPFDDQFYHRLIVDELILLTGTLYC